VLYFPLLDANPRIRTLQAVNTEESTMNEREDAQPPEDGAADDGIFDESGNSILDESGGPVGGESASAIRDTAGNPILG
jgi:hypothetical protein